MGKTNNQNLATLGLIVVQVLFGINHITSKMVLTALHPSVWAALRASSSFIVFGCILLGLRAPRVALSFRKLLWIMFLAAIGIVINQSTFLTALKYTTPSNTALINCLMPVGTLFWVLLLRKERLTPTKGLGFALSFFGVLVLSNVETFNWNSKLVRGNAYAFVSVVSYSLFLALAKELFEDTTEVLFYTVVLFFFGALGLDIISVPFWHSLHPASFSGGMWFCLIFGVFGASVLAYFMSNWALAVVESSRVSLFSYIQPLVAAFLAWIVWNDPLTLRLLLSALLVFWGLWLSALPEATAVRSLEN